jgi:tRNA nucleotidyltransferase (CCA-adding enzyme)
MPVIRDVMSECAVTVRPDVTLADATRTLCENHLSGAPVVTEEGDVVGFISEPALIDVLFDEDARWLPVSRYMTLSVHVVHPDDSLAAAANAFALYNVRRLPVMENNTLVGVLTRRDLLNYWLKSQETFSDPLVELIPALGEYA